MCVPLLGLRSVHLCWASGICVCAHGRFYICVCLRLIVCVDTRFWVCVCVCVVHGYRLLVCMCSHWVLGHVNPCYVLG